VNFADTEEAAAGGEASSVVTHRFNERGKSVADASAQRLGRQLTHEMKCTSLLHHLGVRLA
jgi:hypothetical protein